MFLPPRIHESAWRETFRSRYFCPVSWKGWNQSRCGWCDRAHPAVCCRCACKYSKRWNNDSKSPDGFAFSKICQFDKSCLQCLCKNRHKDIQTTNKYRYEKTIQKKGSTSHTERNPDFSLLSKQHDVPVFDLQQVTNEAVRCAALHEVPLRSQELFTVRRTIFAHEVGEQRQLGVLLDLMQRHSVLHRLDHSTVIRRHDDVVGLHPEWHPLQSPDILENEWTACFLGFVKKPQKLQALHPQWHSLQSPDIPENEWTGYFLGFAKKQQKL